MTARRILVVANETVDGEVLHETVRAYAGDCGRAFVGRDRVRNASGRRSHRLASIVGSTFAFRQPPKHGACEDRMMIEQTDPIFQPGRAEIERRWAARFGRPEPAKVLCVGLNYRDHAIEQRVELPSEPLLFGKFANALCGPGDPIILPAGVGHVDAEAELAVVIGRTARRIAVADALTAVAGYVCANDVSARDLQFKDGQWLRAKGFDTFCPISTDIVPVDELGDARGLRVVQRVNDTVLQDSTTDELVFGVRELVAHASTVFTLEPGDLLLTGTPAGVGVFRDPPVSLADGDVVEIEVERVGVVRNPVVVEPGS